MQGHFGPGKDWGFYSSAVRSQLRKDVVGGRGRGVRHDRIGSNIYFRSLPSLFYSQVCIICSLR